jgi:hypothetical protein
MPLEYAPPRAKRNAPQAAPRSLQNDPRKEAVGGLFQLASFGCVMVGNYADAAAVAEHGDNISREVATLARQNESVAKYIDYLTQAGPYAGLVTACLPLVLQLLANHKRIDYSKVPGLTAPEVLEAKIASQMKAAAIQQMREAQETQARFDAELARMEAAMQPQNGGSPQQ